LVILALNAFYLGTAELFAGMTIELWPSCGRLQGQSQSVRPRGLTKETYF